MTGGRARSCWRGEGAGAGNVQKPQKTSTSYMTYISYLFCWHNEQWMYARQCKTRPQCAA